MLINLDLQKRIAFLSILSKKTSGSIVDWKVVDEAKDALGIKQEEYEEYGMEEKDGKLLCSNIELAKKEHEFDIPKRAIDIVTEALHAKDKTSSLESKNEALLAEYLFRLEEEL